MSRRLARHAVHFGRHLALLVFALLILLPFFWVTAAAFRTQISLLMGDLAFTPVLLNFHEVLFARHSDYMQNFLNSLFVGVVSTVIVLVIAVLASYALDRMLLRRWVGAAFSGWWLVFYMLPPITMVGAWFLIFRSLGLYGTFTGLILSHVTLNFPMTLWIIAVFVRQVPVELEEAARIDGAGVAQILWRIVLPMIRPGLAAAGILAFLFSWNEFAVALNITAEGTQTVPVAIAKYAQEYEIKHTQMAAAAALSMIPAVLLLVLAQRHIVKGLTLGIGK